MMESAAAMESKELEEEGEAMRRTFERIEFLVKQGFLSDVDAARKKQEVIDSFCLAPMVDCRRRVQEGQGEDIVVGLGLGEGSSADMASEESVSTPTSVVAASAIMPEARPSLGEGSSSLEGEQAGEGEQEQSKRPELAESMDGDQQGTHPLPEERIQGVPLEESGLMLPRSPECEVDECHLLPSWGYVGGNARFCAQHRSDGMQLVRQVLTPEDPTPLALPDLASARTSTLTRPGFNTKAVVPQELSLGERVTGDSDTLRFLNPGPDIASVSPPPVAATTSTTPGSASLSVTTSVCVPGNVAVASLEGQTLQTLSVEEDPVPPTVPDPAELKRGTCEWRGCTKEPHYAVKGQRARTCFSHKQDSWVHVSRRRCDREGCPRGAYFSLEGSTAIFCSAHRTPAMLDVVNLRRYKCQGGDCARQAYYNFAGLGRGKAKFCSTHKLPDMLNVRHRLCESEGCGTTPTFSFAGDRPRFCASHKAEGMVDTKSKMCPFVEADGNNCNKCRLYGVPDGKATYCFAHKKEGMINIRQAKKRQKI